MHRPHRRLDARLVDARRGAEGAAGADRRSVAHVAIANPEHAPYGRAAVAAMQSAGVYERVRPKLVVGENVADAAIRPEWRRRHRCRRAVAGAGAEREGQRSMVRDSGQHIPGLEQGGTILKSRRRRRGARVPRVPAERGRTGDSQAVRFLSAGSVARGLDRDLAQRPSRVRDDARCCSRSACRSPTGSSIRRGDGSFWSKRSSRCRWCCRRRCSASTSWSRSVR